MVQDSRFNGQQSSRNSAGSSKKVVSSAKNQARSISNKLLTNGKQANRTKPGEYVEPLGATPVKEALRDCGVYLDGKRLPGKFDHRTGLAEVERFGEGFTWLSLSKPNASQMDAIAELYGLDELTVEDALSVRQRPKLEIHDDHIVFVVRSIHYSPEGLKDDENEIIRSGQLLIVVGENYVITIRVGMDRAEMVRMSDRVEKNSDALEHGPAGVLWALTDMLVDNYLRIAHQLEDRVEDMEDEVFEPKFDTEIEDVYILKREILEMRHAIEPLASALRTLLKFEGVLVPKEVARYLTDVLDHQLVAADMVQGFDERLSALIDAAAVKIQLQQNKDMRTISAYAAILAVPTALAGIYGMNFDNMPELHWEHGYFVVIGIMFAIVVVLVWILRRNKWL